MPLWNQFMSSLYQKSLVSASSLLDATQQVLPAATAVINNVGRLNRSEMGSALDVCLPR